MTIKIPVSCNEGIRHVVVFVSLINVVITKIEGEGRDLKWGKPAGVAVNCAEVKLDEFCSVLLLFI